MRMFFVVAACFFSLVSTAQTITLNLDNVPEGIQCGEVWTEQNLNLQFMETTVDDCYEGSCVFGNDGGEFWLYPSRLLIDVSGLANVEMVEVDVRDNCGVDCTRTFLIDGDGTNVDSAMNSTLWESETLVVENTEGVALTLLAVSSCEGIIDQIRIYQSASSITQAPAQSKKLLRTVDLYGREVNRATNQILVFVYDNGTVEKRFVME